MKPLSSLCFVCSLWHILRGGGVLRGESQFVTACLNLYNPSCISYLRMRKLRCYASGSGCCWPKTVHKLRISTCKQTVFGVNNKLAMKITVTTLGDEIFTLDVSEDMELENFKALCEFESGIPAREIAILWNGRPLPDDKRKLQDYGVKDGEVLLLQRMQGQRGSGGGGGGSSGSSVLGLLGMPGAAEPGEGIGLQVKI